MKTLLKTICSDAFHTQENGNLNIMGIFEHITTQELPATHLKTVFAFILEDESPEGNQQYDYYFDVTGPDGKKIFDSKSTTAPYKVKFGENKKAHLIVTVQMLQLKQQGKHTANFYFGDGILNETLEFDVQKLNPSPF